MTTNSFNGLTTAVDTARAMATDLGIRIGDFGFLLPVSAHCEVIERPIVHPIPNVQAWFNGLLNRRGRIVPVIDLAMLLGASSFPQQRWLFSMGQEEKNFAVWLDDYPQLLSSGEFEIAPPPVLPTPLQNLTVDAYRHNGQTWLRVVFDALLQNLMASTQS